VPESSSAYRHGAANVPPTRLRPLGEAGGNIFRGRTCPRLLGQDHERGGRRSANGPAIANQLAQRLRPGAFLPGLRGNWLSPTRMSGPPSSPSPSPSLLSLFVGICFFLSFSFFFFFFFLFRNLSCASN
jgi:hypothetical protein